VFDSGDLVTVFVAGEYEDGIAGNSTFAEGDWNGDGEFDTGDLVDAFQRGHYVAGALPIAAQGALSLSRGDVAANLLGRARADGVVPSHEFAKPANAPDNRLGGIDLQLIERDELFDELGRDRSDFDSDPVTLVGDELLDELTTDL
jgi:hypothetical protein